MQNLTQNPNFTSSPNSLTWITATTHFISKRVDMKICTYGLLRHPMVRVLRCMFKMYILWTSWRWRETAWKEVVEFYLSIRRLNRVRGGSWRRRFLHRWVFYFLDALSVSHGNIDCWQIFGVPSTARRAKPFVDHILSFSILDNKIWFRNFQVNTFSSSFQVEL